MIPRYLRLASKNYEIVVAPDDDFKLIVIQDIQKMPPKEKEVAKDIVL